MSSSTPGRGLESSGTAGKAADLAPGPLKKLRNPRPAVAEISGELSVLAHCSELSRAGSGCLLVSGTSVCNLQRANRCRIEASGPPNVNSSRGLAGGWFDSSWDPPNSLPAEAHPGAGLIGLRTLRVRAPTRAGGQQDSRRQAPSGGGGSERPARASPLSGLRQCTKLHPRQPVHSSHAAIAVLASRCGCRTPARHLAAAARCRDARSQLDSGAQNSALGGGQRGGAGSGGGPAAPQALYHAARVQGTYHVGAVAICEGDSTVVEDVAGRDDSVMGLAAGGQSAAWCCRQRSRLTRPVCCCPLRHPCPPLPSRRRRSPSTRAGGGRARCDNKAWGCKAGRGPGWAWALLAPPCRSS